MPTIHILIKGKVQGVFFRASAKKVADRLFLTGWIRNTAAGDVEVVITGSVEDLHQFTEWCRQGPERAEVEKVIVEESDESGFEEFFIKRGS